MSTDFGYNNTTIASTGAVRPKIKNVPLNARYRVETFADISKIPLPAVGELVFVMSDENNNSQQNIYVIKSLKASALGVADSLVDEVVPLKTFLGTEDINLSDYVKNSLPYCKRLIGSYFAASFGFIYEKLCDVSFSQVRSSVDYENECTDILSDAIKLPKLNELHGVAPHII